MVNVSNVKEPKITITTTALGGLKESAPNTIFNYGEESLGYKTTEKNKNGSKIDKLLENLCADLSIDNLSPAELKNSGILFRISGMNKMQIEAADEAKLKQIVKCLKAALKESIVGGKIDWEKVGKISNKYFIAENTGWTIDGFENYDKKVKKSSLWQRLKETGCLKKDASLDNTKPEEIQKALFDFFNKTLLNPLKNAKSAKEKASIYKSQLQTFGRLLINTPDKEKAIFKQAIATLAADNRLKGLNAVLASFETPQAKEEWVDSWNVNELKQAMSAKDVEGNIPSDKAQTAIAAGIFSEKTEASIRKIYSEMSEPAKQFFAENAEKLKAIKEKEDKGIALTKEEKELVAQRDSYKNLYSGAMSGTAINTKVEQESKKEILGTMNTDAYQMPIYKEVLKQVNEYIEEHPEALTMPKEELVKLLDEVTNGNYTTVATNSDAELKPPVQKTETVKTTDTVESAEPVKAAKTSTIGFETTKPEAPKLDTLKQQFVNTNDTDNKFTVDKSQKEEKITALEVYNMKNQAFKSASYIPDYLKETGESKFSFAAEVFKKFSDMSTTTQDWAMNYFSNASMSVQNLFLNRITGSVSGMIAAAKEVDLSKFNLIGVSVTTQKQIDKIQEEKV